MIQKRCPAKRLTEKRTTFCYFRSAFFAGKKKIIPILLTTILALSFFAVLVNRAKATPAVVGAISIGASTTSGKPVLEVKFTAAGNCGSTCKTYSWLWGDGTPSSGEPNPTHYFEKAGIFTVELTGMNDNGGSFRSSQVITVNPLSPGESQIEPAGWKAQSKELSSTTKENDFWLNGGWVDKWAKKLPSYSCFIGDVKIYTFSYCKPNGDPSQDLQEGNRICMYYSEKGEFKKEMAVYVSGFSFRDGETSNGRYCLDGDCETDKASYKPYSSEDVASTQYSSRKSAFYEFTDYTDMFYVQLVEGTDLATAIVKTEFKGLSYVKYTERYSFKIPALLSSIILPVTAVLPGGALNYQADGYTGHYGKYSVENGEFKDYRSDNVGKCLYDMNDNLRGQPFDRFVKQPVYDPITDTATSTILVKGKYGVSDVTRAIEEGGSAATNPYADDCGACREVELGNVDLGQLLSNFPYALGCWIGKSLLASIQAGFAMINSAFKDILMLTPENFAQNPVVQTTAGLFIRFINSLFLLVALLSIFVTTLKIDIPGLSLKDWQLRKMIPTIVATMILVNYSLSILGFILEMMNYLVTWFDGGADTVSLFGLSDATYKTLGAHLGLLYLRILLLLVILIITLYLACVLWFRKVVLVVLYMFAPVPWITNILPVKQIQELTGKWWGNFMNWAFMGPLAAILLAAAARASDVATGVGSAPINPEQGSTLGTCVGAAAGAASGSGQGLGLGDSGLTNIILVGVLMYLAATVPLKLGGEAMKTLTGVMSGKKPIPGTKWNPVGSAKESVGKALKTSAYTTAAQGGLRGALMGAAISLKRGPELMKAKADAKLAAAKKDADKALEKGGITQRLKTNPLVKDEVDKAKDKNMAATPQQVMNNAVDAMEKNERNKVAGALKALQDQGKSLDPKINAAAQEQIKQLKNATGIDLNDPKTSVDDADVRKAVDWVKNNANAAKNLKRGFLGGSPVQVSQDLAAAPIVANNPAGITSFVDTLSDTQLDTVDSHLSQFNAETTDAAIANRLSKIPGGAGVSVADIRAGRVQAPKGSVLANYQLEATNKIKAADNARLIANERIRNIDNNEQQMVTGYINDARASGRPGEEARVISNLGREVDNLDRFISGGNVEDAKKLAGNMFGGPGVDSSAWSMSYIGKLASARRGALSTLPGGIPPPQTPPPSAPAASTSSRAAQFEAELAAEPSAPETGGVSGPSPFAPPSTPPPPPSAPPPPGGSSPFDLGPPPDLGGALKGFTPGGKKPPPPSSGSVRR